MSQFVLTIDQGTTGSTALIFDRDMNLISKGYREYRQIYPKPGWVEHDLEDIWTSVRLAVNEALSHGGIRGTDLAAIGITNQRETIGLWDRVTGVPAANAIVWQDRRTADFCLSMRQAGHEPMIRAKTGLLWDPYFSGTKLRWLLTTHEQLAHDAAAGKLAAGTIDTFLTWRLSGGAAHVTDVSNASRTLLFDIHALAWDKDLCDLLGVPMSILPQVRSSSEVYGRTKGLDFLPDGIPVAGIAGDQQAALFGQCCFDAGEAKCTYGTGAFLLVNTGEKAVASEHRLLTTVAWQVGGRTQYALEGSSFIAGAAVQWLRDGLKIIERASDIETLARQVESSDGVVAVPAFVGLGAPHWRAEARGLISGLTRGTTRAHLARATLEGIALQIHDLIDAMARDMGAPFKALKVDGGAAVNDLLMQFQADILGVEVIRPRIVETTALGAAALAGLAVGFWSAQQDVRQSWQVERRFAPQMPQDQRQRHLELWRAAVERA